VTSTLDDLVDRRSIVITCGSGGVGKTTTAAVFALEAARRGRRACVVTIDPAKRLADALGLATLSNTPAPIHGEWAGELWAVMLDTKATFDHLVERYSADAEQAQRILGNRFYRNISGALGGTQEYMAAEKLFELHEEGGFDLVVVDTPPSRNALDFLDAPSRLTRFFDHRLYRVLMMPTRAYLKAVNVAAQAFLRMVSKVVGSDVIADAIAFFQAFDGMEQGFRARASRVIELLEADTTAYVLVASPRHDTVDEARFFADHLRRTHAPVAGLVVNRVHPMLGTMSAEAAWARADDTPLGRLFANLAELRQVAEREREQLAGLAEEVAPAPCVTVPLLHGDVHDLAGLTMVGTYLFGRDR
jgi:anion-transporting  ArsA/GET3 family ATPase